MRSLKKLLAVLLSLTMVLSLMVVPAFAAESLEYEDEAKVLYDLGLFKGKSATEFVPDLESRLERQEGVALVLRLFGLDAEAEKMSESEAKALLAEKFKDADEIGAWAVKYVAYAVKNGIVDGRPDGKFAPKDPLLGKEYAKMILAQLGQYDPNNFQTACADLAAISNLSSAEAIKFNDKILIRDDLVGISYASLTAQYKDGGTVISKLAEANPALKEKAIELGLIAIAKINTVVEPITIKVGEAVQLPAKVEVEYADGSVADVDVSWNTSAVKADVAGEWQERLLKKKGSRIVYPADEFYVMAGCEMPDYYEYEDFPQLENGVGLVALFKHEFNDYLNYLKRLNIDNLHMLRSNNKMRKVSIATGVLAYEFINGLARELEKTFENIRINVYPVKNDFFGEQVTVTGLLTGRDIIQQLSCGEPDLGEELLISESMLKANDDVFLDDYTVKMLEEQLNIKLTVVKNNGKDFILKAIGLNCD
jgi:hypothetical protein